MENKLTPLQANIRALYERSNVSQEVFAETHGVSQSMLNKYINGHAEPNYLFILSICREYNIDSEMLIDRPLHFNKKGEITNRPNKQQEMREIRNIMQDEMNAFYDRMMKLMDEMEKRGRKEE